MVKISGIVAILLVILVSVSCSPTVLPATSESSQPTIMATITPTPKSWSLSNFLLQLNNMAVLPNGEVWAIGQNGIIIRDRVRIAHLSEVFAYQGERQGGYLSAIEFVSENDGWITGFGGQIRRWDGEKWSYEVVGGVDHPNLSDLGFADSNNGWAAGCYFELSDNALSVAVLMHWNGQSWKNITLPGKIGAGTCFENIEAISNTTIWVSGVNYQEKKPLILNWDGTNWKEIPISSVKGITAISAINDNDLWVLESAKVLHWNGIKWQNIELPNDFWFWYSENECAKPDILALANDDVWVGGRQLLHWNGYELENLDYDESYGWIVDIEADENNNVWALTFTGGILKLSNK